MLLKKEMKKSIKASAILSKHELLVSRRAEFCRKTPLKHQKWAILTSRPSKSHQKRGSTIMNDMQWKIKKKRSKVFPAIIGLKSPSRLNMVRHWSLAITSKISNYLEHIGSSKKSCSKGILVSCRLPGAKRIFAMEY